MASEALDALQQRGISLDAATQPMPRQVVEADLQAVRLHWWIGAVFAAHQALKNETTSVEIKASTLNSIRQICAEAGIQPPRETGSELQELSMLLPALDGGTIAGTDRRSQTGTRQEHKQR